MFHAFLGLSSAVASPPCCTSIAMDESPEADEPALPFVDKHLATLLAQACKLISTELHALVEAAGFSITELAHPGHVDRQRRPQHGRAGTGLSSTVWEEHLSARVAEADGLGF